MEFIPPTWYNNALFWLNAQLETEESIDEQSGGSADDIMTTSCLYNSSFQWQQRPLGFHLMNSSLKWLKD